MSDTTQSVRVAIVQAAPVFLDAMASAEKAAQLIAQAAETGAMVAAFGEGWIPGYPMHAFAQNGTDAWWSMAADYMAQTIDIPGDVTRILCDAAAQSGIDVVIGVAERDPITHGTIYSTQLVINSEGEVIGQDRKLKATLHERLVWGDADEAVLTVHERDYGFLSGLSGWDNQMALTAYALAEQGAQFHVAAFPGGESPAPASPGAPWPRQHLIARAFAAQTGTFVICAAGTLTKEDVPERYRDLVMREFAGDSVVVNPHGAVIAGPAKGETILIADCDMAQMRAAKIAFDLSGHSSRTDILQFRHKHAGGGDQDYGEGYGSGYASGSGYAPGGAYDDDQGYGNEGADRNAGPEDGPYAGGWTSEPPPGMSPERRRGPRGR